VVVNLRAAQHGVVSRVQSSSISLETSGPLTLFGIRLNAGAAAGILGVPAIELQKQTVPLKRRLARRLP
jgi:hypothetical protein